MKVYSLIKGKVHTFQGNVHEPGSHGSQLFSCLLTAAPIIYSDTCFIHFSEFEDNCKQKKCAMLYLPPII